MSSHRSLVWAYWATTLVALVIALVAALRAPADPGLGPTQKLICLHLPVAMNMLLAALVVFIASVGHLWGRQQRWDDLAYAGAVVTVLNGAVLLLTGMLLARSAWGVWWTWSPRLAFSLLLCLLFAVYLVLRRALDPGPRRAVVSAVYGVLAFLDVPLLYLTAQLLPDIHPTSMGGGSGLLGVVLLWFVPVTLISAGLIAARYSQSRRSVSSGPCGAAHGRLRGVAA